VGGTLNTQVAPKKNAGSSTAPKTQPTPGTGKAASKAPASSGKQPDTNKVLGRSPQDIADSEDYGGW
jgi:hypothetical protein